MKLYTKTGDKGKTDIKGERVPKDNVRIKIIGEMDEFQAEIGLVSFYITEDDLLSIINRISHDLYLVMSYFSGYEKCPIFNIKQLEDEIDSFQSKTPPHPGKFIRPGLYAADAQMNKCRTKCRRVERKLITIGADELVPYFNRLSDLLYAMQIYLMTNKNVQNGKEAYEVNIK